jgi:hypothetical protein
LGFIVIHSANEQHTIKIAKRVKAFSIGVEGCSPTSDQAVHRLSERRHPGATPFSFAGSDGDPGDDWVGRFEIAKASLSPLHLTATIGVR